MAAACNQQAQAQHKYNNLHWILVYEGKRRFFVRFVIGPELTDPRTYCLPIDFHARASFP